MPGVWWPLHPNGPDADLHRLVCGLSAFGTLPWWVTAPEALRQQGFSAQCVALQLLKHAGVVPCVPTLRLRVSVVAGVLMGPTTTNHLVSKTCKNSSGR